MNIREFVARIKSAPSRVTCCDRCKGRDPEHELLEFDHPEDGQQWYCNHCLGLVAEKLGVGSPPPPPPVIPVHCNDCPVVKCNSRTKHGGEHCIRLLQYALRRW